MLTHEEIKKAIADHGMWRDRLNLAIDTGKSEFAPEVVCTDSCCDFGRWLNSAEMTDRDLAGDHYERVRNLHARFHKITGDLLNVALTGQTDDWCRLVEPGSPFANVSCELPRAMLNWERSTKRAN